MVLRGICKCKPSSVGGDSGVPCGGSATYLFFVYVLLSKESLMRKKTSEEVAGVGPHDQQDESFKCSSWWCYWFSSCRTRSRNNTARSSGRRRQ